MIVYDMNDVINVYNDSVIGIQIDYIKPIDKYIIVLFVPYITEICYANKNVAQYVIKKLSCIDTNRKHWFNTDNLLWSMLNCLYGYK